MSLLDKVVFSRPSPLIHFYPFSTGGILFVEGTRRILTLNHSAALIWCLLGEVAGFAELVSAMADRFPVDRKELERDAETSLEFFMQEGLLGNAEQVEREASPMVLTTQGAEIGDPESWIFKNNFKLSGHVFEVAIQDILLAEFFVAAMSHLAAGKSKVPDTRIWVLPGKEPGDLWDIYLDCRLFDSGIQTTSVLPILLLIVFVRSSDALSHKLLFHAAVLARDNKTILLPGIAGSGKSTLAAALAAQGYRFYSEELALLDKETLKVAPFPMPMSIKDGSVEVLKKYYPALPEAEVCLRLDNKRVRYIIAPQESLVGEDEEAEVKVLVFPSYSLGEAEGLKEIGKADALKRLAETVSSDRELLMDDVEAMIAIVEQSPCYELIFLDLDKATKLLKDLIK